MLAQVILMTLAQTEVPSMLEPWEVPSVEVMDETPRVFLVSRDQKRECSRLGSVCVPREEAPPLGAWRFRRIDPT